MLLLGGATAAGGRQIGRLAGQQRAAELQEMGEMLKKEGPGGGDGEKAGGEQDFLCCKGL